MANQDIENELESFRQKWKEELSTAGNQAAKVSQGAFRKDEKQPSNYSSYASSKPTASIGEASTGTAQSASSGFGVAGSSSGINIESCGGDDDEDECDSAEGKAAKSYFKGVTAEKNGFVYEAMLHYRKAIQLVPDIESRIQDFAQSSDEEEEEEEDDVYNLQATLDDRLPEISALSDQFQMLSVDGKHVCQNQFETRATHISDIPVELLVYIFKWVVSTSLDFRSLEQLSMVCKGFYLCARDREIWRLGCIRIWGANCGFPSNWNNSWRWMFITKPHIWTQGVYISKTTYLRQGEQIQDLWSLHLVSYYRYIKFFNNGTVHVFTSPEEPQVIVPRLNQPGLNLRSGTYKLIGSKVIIDLDGETKPLDTPTGRGRRNKKVISNILENKFHMELEILSTGKRQRHNQLVWSCYYHRRTYRDTGESVISEFDLSSQFPPFFYSRVRSYTRISHAPLQ